MYKNSLYQKVNLCAFVVKEFSLLCQLIKNISFLYLILLKRLKEHFQMKETDCIENLCVSFNESFGTWSKDNNKVIFEKIQAL